MSWDTSLARTLKPRDHVALRTLADARVYMLELPEDVAGHMAWRHAATALRAAAESPTQAAIGIATRQLDVALVVTYRHDISGNL